MSSATPVTAPRAAGHRPDGIRQQIPAAGADVLQRGLVSVGRLVRFALTVVRELPVAIRLYPSEIFVHAGLLIRSNALVVLFMCFTMGLVMAVTVHFAFVSIGIGSYIGAEPAAGNMRGILHVAFGWIFAAKVGCGIVAELGAMRISEEIDAMEVMGIRSIPYLVCTRLLAGILVVPFLWVIALAMNFIAMYLLNVEVLNTVSSGGFIYALFLFQNATDFAFAMIWGTLIAVLIIVVACYYGYTATGGPVGVGHNTAQSMLVNLVLISITAMMLYQLFYGNSLNAPIGN